jgi:hypothetical protein
MNPKLMVLGLAAVLVIAFAVPAFGETTTVTPSVSQGLSVRALAKARLALLTARSAKSQSRKAVRTAGAAVNTANEAVKTAGEAKSAAAATQAALDATRVQTAFAAGSVTTESETPEQLPGGPGVTVTVPSSGLIEVWGQATMPEGGGVSLYEDGQQMAGQDESFACNAKEGVGVLFTGVPFGPPGPTTVGTPAAAATCGTEGAPGPVMFQTTPGKHTYELRYTIGCGCEPEATFSKRLLRVAPRL